jgi:hypothetical protein
LALGACASVALAEPASTVADAKDGAIAEAHAAGPVALTEAEMDQVAAGAVVNWSADLAPENEVSLSKVNLRPLKWER